MEWLEIQQRVTSSVPTVASIQPLGSDWSSVSRVWSTLKVEAGTAMKCSRGNDTAQKGYHSGYHLHHLVVQTRALKLGVQTHLSKG